MYVELHAHSCFSLLDGASFPEDLVARAAALGMPALALTDHDAIYGAVRFVQAAKAQGIHPILGAELTLTDGSHLTLLVENETGWHNLCYLISRGRRNAPKGESALAPAELVGCTGGLIALSGCRKGGIAAALRRGEREVARQEARHYRELFGQGQFFIELQRHFLPGEERLIPQLTALASYLHLPIVATNNVHYVSQDGHRLQDVLVCIRHLTTLDESLALRRPNSEYYLKSPGQMADLFADYPQAISNTVAIAERCRFDLHYGLQDLPLFATPHGLSSQAYLNRLCEQAIPERYGEAPTRAREQMRHELTVIEQAGLSNYFLIVWDIVRFAREQGILCQGRGSAANSLVAYFLAISPIDPLAHDLVFERFLSRERPALPDIDLDFDAARREEAIQYVYDRYGEAHAAMACTFVTFRARSALRDVGKVLGLGPDILGQAERILEGQGEGLAAAAPVPQLLDLCQQIEGLPRHLGIHSGGMVITGAPLMGRVATEPATMADRMVVQWDKEGLEEAGLVKIDLLGLRMLSAISDAVKLVATMNGTPTDLARLTFDDPAVYEMISQADTIGVFQVESSAQAQMLPRLRPRTFADLVVAISLIRPGPIQGNMVHPYLRRREGVEPVSYLHPLLEPSLQETLGVVLFQEQVLKVARDLAGFTAGQGEQLRRALGAKDGTAAVERFRELFLAGAAANGVSADIATQVFDQLRAFGSYSFAKSHAAAFAVLVYQSAWLKRYQPIPFYTALLNNQPMGFWNAAVIVNEVQRQGIPVRPVDIQVSQWRCTIEDGAIRIGLSYVKGLGETVAEQVINERQQRPFADLADFRGRVALGRELMENLILSGAMDRWGRDRRQLLWQAGIRQSGVGELALTYPQKPVDLPVLSPLQELGWEQMVTGVSPANQVMAFYRAELTRRGFQDSQTLTQCVPGQRVKVAGLVVVHQAPPTAKGFHFITLEDERGMVNVVVRPRVYAQFRRLLHQERVLWVTGVVERQGTVVNVVAVGFAAAVQASR
ncbi:MAG: DNA polymerase III subunit alpha [Chloroflexi bacterium]|nr:DNA polymerase III subunit alpha [Chloroflexota bacterium]